MFPDIRSLINREKVWYLYAFCWASGAWTLVGQYSRVEAARRARGRFGVFDRTEITCVVL